MNAAQRETFRESILRVLDERASDRFGLQVSGVIVFLGQYGFRHAQARDVNAELLYLADKNLVAVVGKTISPENTSWRITADGRDYVAGLTYVDEHP